MKLCLPPRGRIFSIMVLKSDSLCRLMAKWQKPNVSCVNVPRFKKVQPLNRALPGPSHNRDKSGLHPKQSSPSTSAPTRAQSDCKSGIDSHLPSSMAMSFSDTLAAWHPWFSPVVTPGFKSSSQPTLPSADHLLFGHTGAPIESIRSQSGTCLHPSWEQLLPPFCQDWTHHVSPRRLWSPLCHPVLSGAAWQQGESCARLGTVSWSGQAKAALVPLPIYPKAYKKSVQVSHAAGGFQEPCIHCSEQEGSDKYEPLDK